MIALLYTTASLFLAAISGYIGYLGGYRCSRKEIHDKLATDYSANPELIGTQLNSRALKLRMAESEKTLNKLKP